MKIDPNILNAFLTLMGSVTVLGLILFLMKKITLKFKNKSNENNLEIVSKLNLSPKNSIWTIKVHDKLLVLGVSEKNINLLTEIDNKTSSNNKIENSNLLTKSKPLTKTEKISEINNDLSFKEFLKSAVFKNN